MSLKNHEILLHALFQTDGYNLWGVLLFAEHLKVEGEYEKIITRLDEILPFYPTMTAQIERAKSNILAQKAVAEKQPAEQAKPANGQVTDADKAAALIVLPDCLDKIRQGMCPFDVSGRNQIEKVIRFVKGIESSKTAPDIQLASDLLK